MTMIGMFCVAKIKEQAIKARQSRRVNSICRFAGISLFLTAGIRSTATAEAEVSTTASSVDIEAESKRIIIMASRIIPSVPPLSTLIKTAGITESIPPSGSSPFRIKREVLPTRYAPQPMTMQKMVEITVPRLMAAVSLMA